MKTTTPMGEPTLILDPKDYIAPRRRGGKSKPWDVTKLFIDTPVGTTPDTASRTNTLGAYKKKIINEYRPRLVRARAQVAALDAEILEIFQAPASPHREEILAEKLEMLHTCKDVVERLAIEMAKLLEQIS